ncbi:glycosyltransferase [uncultured Bacteroides sp.]|uniref:glycosyltransferase n=1 Tax=uncultured Bacteroides sp. TaxID=162156 RepID=UPI002595F8CF|nr:glycosyltransferase [uncultured Bacteroides sp.]
MLEPTHISIIIVTFNPDNSILKLLNSCLLLSSQIIVVDNGSKNSDIIKKEINQASDNIQFIPLEKNYGIGYAINRGIREIDFSSKKWVITFDQDSLPPHDLLRYYDYVVTNENNIGLIGLNYSYYANIESSNKKIIYKKSLDQITSGLMHNTEIFKNVGLYNEKMFIDCVDFEYTLRVNRAGYKTITIENKVLNHRIGNPKTVYFCGFKIISMNHNSFRQYFIVRNHIWLAKKYFRKYPFYILKKIYHLLVRIIKTILIDDDKLKKITKILLGIKDGIIYHM